MTEELNIQLFDEYQKYYNNITVQDKLTAKNQNRISLLEENYFVLMQEPNLRRLDNGIEIIANLFKHKSKEECNIELLKAKIFYLLINYDLIGPLDSINENITYPIINKNASKTFNESYYNVLTIYNISKKLDIEIDYSKVSPYDTKNLINIFRIYFKNNKALEYLCDRKPNKKKVK